MKIDKDDLDEALEEIRPLYEKSQKDIKDRNENFFGMNKNRPKNSASDNLFEAAQFLSSILPHIEPIEGLEDDIARSIDHGFVTTKIITAANELSEIIKVMEKK